MISLIVNMEKLKKFVKKNQVLLIAVCVCIAALTATFFAGGNLSDSKVQTASTASSISTTSADTEKISVSATEKITQSPTDSTKSNKDNKDKKDEKDNKNSEDKKNSKVSSQNSSSSSVEKSEKTEQVSGNSTSDKKKPSSSSNSSSKPNKKNDVQPTTQDKYKTDPVPSGKPKPVEPQEQETKDTNLYCTFTITCSTILNNMDDLDPEKIELVPKDGIIFKKQKIQFKEGESVFDVLKRVCMDNNIHMESSWTPMYNSAYIEGINNLYEFDCGELSGWMYSVNGSFPNYGFADYFPQDGDVVRVCFTLALGRDVGGGDSTGGSSSDFAEFADYARVNKLLALIRENEFYGSGEEAYAKAVEEISVWDASQELVDRVYNELIAAYGLNLS